VAIASLFEASSAMINQVTEVFCPGFAELCHGHVFLRCACLFGITEELVHKFVHLI
jgi:hypothetical protein